MFLFATKFADGSFYEQNQNDTSEINPSKSCFYNILQQTEQGNPPEIFALINQSNQDCYLVNLLDGSFEVNDKKIWLHDFPPENPFRLIYFRKCSTSISMGGEVGPTETNSYNFGWQTLYQGRNEQRIITIK